MPKCKIHHIQMVQFCPACRGSIKSKAKSRASAANGKLGGRPKGKNIMSTIPVRPTFTEMPERIKSLPIDERGYPVPWFVDYIEGKPEFRAMDGRKYKRAINERLCWVCGDRLGRNMVFVAGPMCGINRTSSEPPSHYECAKWSAINCPFLNNPRMVRREDDLINNQSLREAAPGCAITRNPGVAMLWITRQYELFNDGRGKQLIAMGEPERVEWYCKGRQATRAEVQESIDTGLPNLLAIAAEQKGATEMLNKYVQRFEKYIPKE